MKTNRSSTAIGFALAILGLSTGCEVGPDYERPPIDAPANWHIDFESAADVANTLWWRSFGDPVLDQLINDALQDNLDVRAAAARVDQFLGALQTTRAEMLPQFTYGADASRTRASRVGQPPVPDGTDPTYNLFQGALGASWQIDLFGRVQRLSEAARARVLASEQARRGVVMSLVTSVAANYIALRALDRQLEVSVATAKNFGTTLQIFELRFGGGVASEMELAQVRSQFEQALASIPAIERQIAVQEHLLSVLLGRNPDTIPRGRAIDELQIPAVPADLPASLLERRPDILEAEQLLIAANANIGAAKALYYPQLSLTGVLGSVSTAFGDFLTGPAGTWSVGAGLAGPIFTAGSIEGQVQTSEAARREAEAFYRQVILNAFRETSDALVGTQLRRSESEAQRNRVVALQNYARLSRLRYDNGYAGYLEVLYAENELFTAELTEVRVRAEQLGEVVNTFKAMGGGWVDAADVFAMESQPDPDAAADQSAGR